LSTGILDRINAILEIQKVQSQTCRNQEFITKRENAENTPVEYSRPRRDSTGRSSDLNPDPPNPVHPV
jgi:hypothetical protein